MFVLIVISLTILIFLFFQSYFQVFTVRISVEINLSLHFLWFPYNQFLGVKLLEQWFQTFLRLWLPIAKLPNRNAVFCKGSFTGAFFKNMTLSQDVEPILRASVFWEIHTGSPPFACQLFSQAFLPLIITQVAVEDQFGS